MRNSIEISASLVLFKPELEMVAKTLKALQVAVRVANQHFKTHFELFLVDNSAHDETHANIVNWLSDFRAETPDLTLNLLRAPGNVGYGRGNNIAISQIHSDYHAVVNPDLFVEPDSLLEAVRYMDEHTEVGLLSPSVIGEDGERHYLCKRNPTLLIMFLRSFSPSWVRSKLTFVLDKFEMRDCDYDLPIYPLEYPTGCFMFFRSEPLKAIGGFDPDFFLHYEDADIGRRMLSVAQVTYVPAVRVIHKWARDTHRTLRSSFITVRSGWLYWRKWGGIFSAKQSWLEIPGKRNANCSNSANNSRGGGRVLVTGANGFIGKAVCKHLYSLGYGVRGAVRQPQSNSLPENVDHVVFESIDELTDWSVALNGVDSVIHLAGRVHQMNEPANSSLDIYRRVNVGLTLSLARQAAKCGVRRFVFISTIKVNGEATPFGQPFTADSAPRPIDPYGKSKLEAENALLQLGKETGMEVVIIRPVLVYGPGVRANFYEMIRWIKKGIPLPLGALSNRRSLVGIDNLVDLIVTCLHHPAAKNQIFLVSDGEDLSIAALLKRTAVALNYPARLLPIPVQILHLFGRALGKKSVVDRLCDSLQVDITKTKVLLGWSPVVTVDEALNGVAREFRRG